MNADKTDNSNTNRVQGSNARYYTSREKPKRSNWKANLLEIYMLKSKDLQEGKRSEISRETPNL